MNYCTVCGSRKLLQPARYLDLRLPVLACAWLIGLLVLKLMIANIGTVLSFPLAACSSIGTFLLGDSVQGLFAGLSRVLVFLILVWFALYRMLGAKSLPIKFLGWVIKGILKHQATTTQWIIKTAAKAIGDQGQDRNDRSRGDRGRQT